MKFINGSVFILMLYLNSSAIMLDGVEVPKEKFIVYVLIGHSNMGGSSSAFADEITHPKAWNFRWFDANNWVLAKEERSGMSGGLSGRTNGGLGMWFLKAMAAEYPDYYFGVVVTASLSSTCRAVNTGSNSSDLTAEENRWTKGTPLYQETLTAVNRIKADVTFGGILCMLGAVEGTRVPNSERRLFSTDIDDMITDMRADMGVPKMPFYMGQYEEDASGTFSIDLPGPKIVYDESNLIPTKSDMTALVLSGGVQMQDDHHFRASDAGYGEWSRRVIALMKENHWEPQELPDYHAGTSSIEPFDLNHSKNYSFQNSGDKFLIYDVSGRLKKSRKWFETQPDLPAGNYIFKYQRQSRQIRSGVPEVD